jgi:hypothetical protein
VPDPLTCKIVSEGNINDERSLGTMDCLIAVMAQGIESSLTCATRMGTLSGLRHLQRESGSHESCAMDMTSIVLLSIWRKESVFPIRQPMLSEDLWLFRSPVCAPLKQAGF